MSDIKCPACGKIVKDVEVNPICVCGKDLSAMPRSLYKLGLQELQKGNNIIGLVEITTAANGGLLEAESLLGTLYYGGHGGVKKDYYQAVSWFRIAAKYGDADSQYFLGVCYINGWGTFKDEKIGIDWLKKAKKSGSQDATILLCSLGL